MSNGVDGAADRDAAAPAARADLIERPRLLDVMAARFDRPVTLITAGAGFGKTSLLVQSMSDPATSASGIDVFHRIGTGDLEGASVLAAFSRRLAPGAPSGSLDRLVDQLWSESPRHVTLVLDDAHRLPVDSAVFRDLDDLVDAMPSNAHLVVSSRRRPEMRLSRLLATGAAVEIDEDDLAFNRDEIAQFARVRGVAPEQLAEHGWPALLELEVHSGTAGAHDFVAEEILADIGDERIRALRLVSVSDVIDDEMVAALTDFEGGAAALAADLPLRTQVDDGSLRLHDLWRELLVRQLSTDELTATRSLLAAEYLRRGDLAEAHAVAIRSGDDEVVRGVLTQLALDYQAVYPVEVRRAVVEATPASFAELPEMLIVRADADKALAPSRALPSAEAAAAAARGVEGLIEIEAHAYFRIAEISYRHSDIERVIATRRDFALAMADRTPTSEEQVAIGAIEALIDMWILMLDNSALKAFDSIESSALQAYEPLASLVDYFRISLLSWGGRNDAAWHEIEEMRRRPTGRVLLRLGGLISQVQWFSGRLTDEERENVRELLGRIELAGQFPMFMEGAAVTSVYDCCAGDLANAADMRRRAQRYQDRMPDGAWGSIMLETATAAADFVAGDEALAAARLREAMPPTGPFRSRARHMFGHVGALTYALVPESREYFHAEDVGPDYELATQVGSAIVALRDDLATAPAAALPWDDLSRLRCWALEPHLAELALAAIAHGHRPALAALESLRHDPRRDIRAVAERYAGHRVGDAAVEHLATSPVRPSAMLEIGVLGPLTLRRGGVSLDDAEQMRRRTVRDLLFLLVHRRRIRRSEAMAILWPDSDDKQADSNLRAALRHLRSLVEPPSTDEESSPPPWFVRSGVDDLVLFGGDLLEIDSDAFSREVELGRRADREQRSANALEHFERAVEQYAGEYLAGATDSEWAQTHRTSLHLEFVDAATRASELLTANGSVRDARERAARAVAAEPLSERAHRALARAVDAAGDRAGARRAIETALRTLRDDGLTPEPDTVRLAAELSQPARRRMS